MNRKGILYVVSAPSGCGKGTILGEVFKDQKNVFYSVSATTRAPREGETDGVHYYFLTKDKFKEMVSKGEMLEYAEYCENMYGTPRLPVEEKLNAGIDVILEIETDGALQVKKVLPEAVMIFILPPSVKELKRRLLKRGSEEEETINKRVNRAVYEIKNADKYDYIVMNDELEEAVADFKAVIKAAKFEKNKNLNLIYEVLENA